VCVPNRRPYQSPWLHERDDELTDPVENFSERFVLSLDAAAVSQVNSWRRAADWFIQRNRDQE
jgi:hypothetical protein